MLNPLKEHGYVKALDTWDPLGKREVKNKAKPRPPPPVHTP